MEEEYRLRKFTKEDLANFNYIEERAWSFPLVRDSLDYLLDVLYRFENYVVEKIIFRNKRQLKLRKNNFSDSTDLIKIVDRIEEYSDELSIDERLFISKIRNLITHVMRRLHVDGLYSKSRLRNDSPPRLEKHTQEKRIKVKDKSDVKDISSVNLLVEPKQKVIEGSRFMNNKPGDEKPDVNQYQNKFRGNSLEKRKSGNLSKYMNAAKLIKMMEDEFKYLSGVQKKACELANCDDKSFSNWINASSKNNALFNEWKNSVEDNERVKLREQINKYIKNLRLN